MGGVLGLVAGAGHLPGLVASEARRGGWRVVAVTLADGAGTLESHADRVVACRLGDVGPLLGLLAEEGIRHVVLAGKVSKSVLFQGGALDDAARRLLARAADWSDEGLLRTAASALETLGIELLDQRTFLAPWLARGGRLAGPDPAESVSRDAALGFELARDLAGRGVGQTVVVRAGTVIAVEALEGTDETIRRGMRLAGAGATVVKVAAPGQDYRFDVPTVGAATAALLAEGRAAALAVEAGRVLVLDPEVVAATADGAGFTVLGVGGPRADR